MQGTALIYQDCEVIDDEHLMIPFFFLLSAFNSTAQNRYLSEFCIVSDAGNLACSVISVGNQVMQCHTARP